MSTDTTHAPSTEKPLEEQVGRNLIELIKVSSEAWTYPERDLARRIVKATSKGTPLTEVKPTPIWRGSDESLLQFDPQQGRFIRLSAAKASLISDAFDQAIAAHPSLIGF